MTAEQAFTVLRSGPLATVQDEGRPGLASLGVSRSGAADRASYRLANRLVGNRSGAPALEVTLGGLVVRAESDLLVALAGAPCPGAPLNASIRLRRGDVVTLGVPPRGLRTYLAVRGGIQADAVLGSCSTDLLSGLGPDPLLDGDRLTVGGAAGEFPAVDLAPVAPVGAADEAMIVRVLPGPRRDWFGADAWSSLTRSLYRVTRDSNRIGVRLRGAALGRGDRPAEPRELASEGLVRGSVQVPPSGQPLVFLADHPTTGGFPVLACVHDDDVDALAQLREGDGVGFRSVRGRTDGSL